MDDALEAFLKAAGGNEEREVMERHPELFNDDAISQLQLFEAIAQEAAQPETAEVLRRKRMKLAETTTRRQMRAHEAIAVTMMTGANDPLRELQAALKKTSGSASPVKWARIQNQLGLLEVDSLERDPVDAAERAILYHHQAATAPALNRWERAIYELNLGSAFVKRALAFTAMSLSGGSRDEGGVALTVSEAIRSFDRAAEVFTEEAAPLEWAMVQAGRGKAWMALARGGGNARRETATVAIGCFDDALRVFNTHGLRSATRSTAIALGAACIDAEHWADAVKAYAVARDASWADQLYPLRMLSDQADVSDAEHWLSSAAFALARSGNLTQAVTILEESRAQALGRSLASRTSPESPRIGIDRQRTIRQLTVIESIAVRHAIAPPVESPQVGFLVERHARQLFRQWLQREVATNERNLTEGLPQEDDGFVDGPAQYRFEDIAAQAESKLPLAYLVVAPSGGSLTMLVEGRPSDRKEAPGERMEVNVIEVASPNPLSVETLTPLLVKTSGEEVVGGYLPAQTTASPNLREALRELWTDVGDRLVKPLARELHRRGATGVILIPCGPLALLPLHAFPYSLDEVDRCLVRDFDVTYAPSARVLKSVRGRQKDRAAISHRNFVAVCNPPHPVPLPWAEAEVEEVAALFEASNSRVLYHDEATTPAFLEVAHGADYVHLACHGKFDPWDPLESYLSVAHEGRPARLTLRDLITLGHPAFEDARLVVASACESAMTDFAALPDEAIGFPAGFLQSGSTGAVGTLWAVPDASTALLMVRFYELLLRGDGRHGGAPLHPARALRFAQLWLADATVSEMVVYLQEHPILERALLAQSSAPAATDRDSDVRNSPLFGASSPTDTPYKDPYFWASFVFAGV